jgi:hypothetical protein
VEPSPFKQRSQRVAGPHRSRRRVPRHIAFEQLPDASSGIAPGHDELNGGVSRGDGFGGEVHAVLRVDGAEIRVKRCRNL